MRKPHPDSVERCCAWSRAVPARPGSSSASAQTTSDIVNTKHNLSVSGPGVTRAPRPRPGSASSVTRPTTRRRQPSVEQGARAAGLHRVREPHAEGRTASAALGPTKLCLSCHDGTIAMGAVVNPGGRHHDGGRRHAAAGEPLELRPGPVGTSPGVVSVPQRAAQRRSCRRPRRPSSPTAARTRSTASPATIRTRTLYGKFLIKDNRYSALCTTCHQIAGWPARRTRPRRRRSSGILPRPPKTWPTYTQLNEWGCEACHTPHFAPTAEHLLNFTAGRPPFSCTTGGCHASVAGPPARAAPGRAASRRHRQAGAEDLRAPRGDPVGQHRPVEPDRAVVRCRGSRRRLRRLPQSACRQHGRRRRRPTRRACCGA